jgi:hypothetical protein
MEGHNGWKNLHCLRRIQNVVRVQQGCAWPYGPRRYMQELLCGALKEGGSGPGAGPHLP